MILPNLKDAKVRTNKEVAIKTNEYYIDSELEKIGFDTENLKEERGLK